MPEISDSSPLKWPMALLFDMDLTLIRSRHFWRAAEQTLLEHLGLNPQMDVHHCYNGMHAIDAGKAMHKLLQPALSADECVRVFRQALIKQFQTQPIEAMPGAVALVQRYAGKLPMAIASGSHDPHKYQQSQLADQRFGRSLPIQQPTEPS